MTSLLKVALNTITLAPSNLMGVYLNYSVKGIHLHIADYEIKRPD